MDLIVGLTACSDEGSNGGSCKPIVYQIESPPSSDGGLEHANQTFHDIYGQARERKQRQPAPVLILLGDELILHRGEERTVYPIGVPLYHALKTVAHLAVALLAGRSGIEQALEQGKRGILQLEMAPEVRHDLEAVLDACTKPFSGGEATPDTRALGDLLLRLTDHATKVQVDVLHRQVELALADFTAAERLSLEVLVVGDHQARARSLGVQYFTRRLGEEEGAELRVAFGEAVASEREALALVATRRLDRELAGLLFGDSKRLQRDILGDAAKARLEALNLPRI